MKALSISLAIMLSITVSNGQEHFSLEGHVTGYPGKVKLILNFIGIDHQADMINEQVIYMSDGEFKIEGSVPEPQLLSIRIRPEDSRDFSPQTWEDAFIWIENKSMILQGEKGNFRYSNVKGSEIQDENEKLLNFVNNQLKTHALKLDSLKNIRKSSPATRRKIEEMTAVNRVFLENNFRLDYAYRYPNSFISVHTYSWFVKWLPAMVPNGNARSFYSLLNDDLKNSIYGLQIKNYVENIVINAKLNLGDKPYDFTLADSTGSFISLHSLKGKVYLIDFWASSCGPCRLEHLNYARSFERYKSQGFQIISVNMDQQRTAWTKAARKDGMVWISLWDPTMAVSKYLYLVSAIPQNYLIDSKGKIVAENLRGEELAATLERLLPGKE